MALKLEEYTRNRCIGWIRKEDAERAKTAGLRDAQGDLFEAGKGLYSADFIDSNDQVQVELATFFGIDPATVKPITLADLPPEYSQGADSAVKKLREEWKMDSNADVMWHLVLNARLQDAANESVKAHRPVTDKARDRAFSTTLKVLMAQNPGKSEAEVTKMYDSVLSALRGK